VLAILNRSGVASRSPYLLVGLIIWVALLKSGVHATLAGVVVALFIPFSDKSDLNYSPLKSLEHDLHSVVAFFVLPVFAFANAGVHLSDLSMDVILHDVPVQEIYFHI
jgi:NhaA family Na+:H+ antiporter